jgi:predicted peptidase
MSGKCFLSFFLLAGLALSHARADDKTTGFLQKVFKGDKGESKYGLFVPYSYQGDKEVPLILFLHGAGERGDDGETPVKQGIGNDIKKKGRDKDFPAIIIFPQAATKGTWKAGSPDTNRALAILDEVMKTYKVDQKRIYLTGLSMGGYGTWSLAAAMPTKWAAIVPICGGGNPKNAEKIKDIPCWCFHGDKDEAVNVEKSREMIKALKAAGADPHYTEYPGVGHNSWDRAYQTPELYEWLFKQKRN